MCEEERRKSVNLLARIIPERGMETNAGFVDYSDYALFNYESERII